MPRRIRTTLVLCALLLAASAARAAAQPTPSGSTTLIATYEAWLAGNHQVIAQRFPNAQAFRGARDDIQRTLRQWLRAWRPSQAAFLLELSFVGFDRQWNEAPDLLAGTRDLVVNRPAAPGANTAEDEFELVFHRAAVTFFLGRQMLRPANDYLSALAGRVDLVPATTGKPRLVDPWMTFARGMAAEIATSPGLRAGSRDSDAESSLVIPASQTAARRQAEHALAELARVSPFRTVAAEAAVRRGLLLIRVDRPDEALNALDEAEAAGGDDAVRYWTWLFRGRALERLERHVDAAAAYERAAAIVPGAQSPAVALASLWQRHDRPAEALSWARRAMNTPAGAIDPWWLYWRGDLRHASERLAALRRARP
jgi:tetratricopeptide (TPR) repeat protein